MLQFFRNFFKSKFGVPVTLAFLIVIAIAFTSGDLLGGNNTFGGIAGGDRVAVIGDRKISTSDLSQAMTTALTPSSPSASSIAFTNPSRTAALSAFTGGLFDRMISTSPCLRVEIGPVVALSITSSMSRLRPTPLRRY